MMKDQKKRCNVDDLMDLEIFQSLNEDNQKVVVKNQEKEKLEKRSLEIVSEVSQNIHGQVIYDSEIVSDSNDLTHQHNSGEIKSHSTAPTKDTNIGIGPNIDGKKRSQLSQIEMINEEPNDYDNIFCDTFEVPPIKMIDEVPKNRANMVDNRSEFPPIQPDKRYNHKIQPDNSYNQNQNQEISTRENQRLLNNQPGYYNDPEVENY